MKINEETTKKLMKEMIQASDKVEEREDQLLDMGITISYYDSTEYFFKTLFDDCDVDYWDIILDRSKPVEERVEELIKIYDKQDETFGCGED